MIPENADESVNLEKDALSKEEQREKILNFLEIECLEACSYYSIKNSCVSSREKIIQANEHI